MKTQRVRFDDGEVSFTIVDQDGTPLTPAEQYLRYLRQTASPNTVRAYARALTRWFTHLDNVAADWVTFPQATFGDYLTWLRTGRPPHMASIGPATTWLAPSSVSQHAAAVVAFYTYQADVHGVTEPHAKLHRRSGGRRRQQYQGFLAGFGKRSGSDSLAFPVRGVNRDRPPVLKPAEVTAVLRYSDQVSRSALCASRDRLMVMTLWETGIRVGELLGLRHQDFSVGQGETPWVDVVARQDHPHGIRGKTATPRRIYISDELSELYAAYLWALIDAGIDLTVDDLGSHHVFVNVAREPLWKPMRVETLYQKVTAIRRQNQALPPFTPHWFRHTHATALLLAGTPVHVVMRRLGHADVQTTLSTYGWVTEDAQMQALSGWRDLTSGWRGLP